MKRAFAICGTVVVTVFIAGTAAVKPRRLPLSTAAPAAEGTANKTPPFKKEELE